MSGIGEATDTLTERLDRTFTHPVLGVLVFAVIMGGMFWTLFALATLPMDLIEATFAWLGGVVGRDASRGADSRSRGRRHHRRHCGIGRVPAADLPALLPDQPARRHRLSRPRCLRHGSAALPVRPAGTRVRPAALQPCVRAAGHHGGAAHSGSTRSAGHDPRRAAHELLGAAARSTCCSRACSSWANRCWPAWPSRRAICWAAPRRSSARSSYAARSCKGSARPMVLELPSYKLPSLLNALVSRTRSGGGLPEDRRHGHHGDLHRDVVAERVSAVPPSRPRRPRCGRRRRLRQRRRKRRRCTPKPIRSRRGPSRRTASPAGWGASHSRSSRRSATIGS